LLLTTSFQIDNVRVGSGDLFLIAGPCVIESEKHALFMAEVIKGITRSLNVPFIFKASYDKANRTSIRSFRGPGLEEGLRILKKVKDEVHIPVLTDVHETADVPRVAEVVDILQIPAFLCRQTDLIVAAALSGYAIPHAAVTAVTEGRWLHVGGDSLRLEPIDLPDAPGALVAYAPSLEWLYSASAANPLYLDRLLAHARARGWRVSRVGSARGALAPSLSASR